MKLSKWEVENTDNIYIPTESFGWCIGRRGCKTQGEVWLADNLCQRCWDKTGRNYENELGMDSVLPLAWETFKDEGLLN